MAFGVLTQQVNRFFLCNAKRDNLSNRPTLPWGPGRRNALVVGAWGERNPPSGPSGFPTENRERCIAT